MSTLPFLFKAMKRPSLDLPLLSCLGGSQLQLRNLILQSDFFSHESRFCLLEYSDPFRLCRFSAGCFFLCKGCPSANLAPCFEYASLDYTNLLNLLIFLQIRAIPGANDSQTSRRSCEYDWTGLGRLGRYGTGLLRRHMVKVQRELRSQEARRRRCRVEPSLKSIYRLGWIPNGAGKKV